MNFFKGFSLGISSYGRALAILFNRRFWWFMLFPIAMILLFYCGGLYLTSFLGEPLSDWVESYLSKWIESVSWLSWITTASGFVVWLLTKLVWILLVTMWGGYIVLFIMSPIYSWLSEKVESELSGKKYDFNIRRFMYEIGRGMWIAVRNMLLQLFLTILLFAISFIPLINLLTPFAFFVLTSYFYGYAFIDYSVERKRISMKDSILYVERNSGIVIGNGAVFSLFLMVPFLNMIVCSFVSLVSVIAATVALQKNDDLTISNVNNDNFIDKIN